MPNWFEGEAQAGSDYSGTVSSCEFVEGKFGKQAVLTTTLDSPITKNDGTLLLEMPAYYGLPDGWNFQGGRLVHNSGDLEKLLPASNKFQKVIKAAADCDQAAVAYLTRDGMNPYMEAAWTGARFHFMTVEAGQDYNVKDRDTGEQKTGKTKGFPAPVEWLGTKDAPLSGDVGAPVASSVDAAGVLADIGLSESAFDSLTALAGKASGTQFVTDAMEYKGEASNVQAFVKALSNGTLHGALLAE